MFFPHIVSTFQVMVWMVNLACPPCYLTWSRDYWFNLNMITGRTAVEWGIDWRPFRSDICKHLPHHQSYYFGPKTSELSEQVEISNSGSQFSKLKNLLGKIENRNRKLRGILDLQYTRYKHVLLASDFNWQTLQKKISLQPSLTHRSNNSFFLVCGL